MCHETRVGPTFSNFFDRFFLVTWFTNLEYWAIFCEFRNSEDSVLSQIEKGNTIFAQISEIPPIFAKNPKKPKNVGTEIHRSHLVSVHNMKVFVPLFATFWRLNVKTTLFRVSRRLQYFCLNCFYEVPLREMSQQIHKFSVQTIAYGGHFTTWLRRSLQKKIKTAGKKCKLIIRNVFKVRLRLIVVRLWEENVEKSGIEWQKVRITYRNDHCSSMIFTVETKFYSRTHTQYKSLVFLCVGCL